MRKLIVAAVVLLVLGGLTAFALLNLDRLVNRNKDYILAQAEQALGRKVTVQDIGVTLWGGVGVRLKDVTLADDRAFSTQDFLRTADLQVNVAFFPLLRKELQIKRLILHKPVLTVIRDKSGTFNFASIGGPGRAERQAPSAGGAPPSPAGRAVPLLASLVDVSGGEVRYVDRTDGTELRVSQLDLTVRNLGVDQPVAIKAAAAVLADRQNLSIQGQVGPLRFTAGGPALNDLPVKMEFSVGPVTMDVLRRFAPVAAWVPRDLKVDGPLSFSGRTDGTLENLTLTGQVDATASRVRYGELLHKPQGMPLRLAAEARVTPGIIEVHKGTLAIHTLELAGTGTMTRGTPAALRFSVDSKRTDLNGWEKVVPLPQGYALAGRAEVHARIEGALAAGRIPDVTGSLVLSELRATLPQIPHPLTAQSATVTLAGRRAALADTPFRLGKSEVRLASQVEHFAPLALTYRASAPEVRPADWIQGRPATKKPELLREVKSDGRIWMEKGSLVARGKVSSPRGTISDVEYTDLQALLSLADRVVTIDSLALRAYGGSLQGRGEYDLRKTPPRFTLTSQIRGMEIGQLLGAWSDVTAKQLRGGVNLDVNLAGNGTGWEEIQRGLSGQGTAEIVRGALVDTNIADSALAGLAGAPGLSMFISPRTRSKYPQIFATRNTEFTELKGAMSLKDGKVQLENLLVAAADWGARGKGWVGLDRTMDVRALLVLSREFSTDLISDVKALRYLANKEGRVEIPFAMAGTFPGVTPKPDTASISRLLERRLLGKGVEDLTKGLLKGKQQEAPAPAAPANPQEPAKPPEKKPEEELLKDLKRLFRR